MTTVSRSRSFNSNLSNTDSQVLGGIYRQYKSVSTCDLSSENRRRQSAASGSTPSLPAITTPAEPPPLPNPNRVRCIFDCVKSGLNHTIATLKSEINDIQSVITRSGFLQSQVFEREKQVKVCQHKLYKMEYHLQKIGDLEENYIQQQQLREASVPPLSPPLSPPNTSNTNTGARNMANAFSALKSHNSTAIHNVKLGFKECTQTLCAIEAQFETMLGTFKLQMKGLTGFARLTKGDAFEVSVRYGPRQKWRCKGKVGRSQQTWTNETTTLRSLISHALSIKVVELKSFGNSVSLGRQFCETKALFCSVPQVMSINVNNSGSIKLTIVVTWNPLEGVDDNFITFAPRTLSQAINTRQQHLSLYNLTNSSNHSHNSHNSNISNESHSSELTHNSDPTHISNPAHQFDMLHISSDTIDSHRSLPANSNDLQALATCDLQPMTSSHPSSSVPSHADNCQSEVSESYANESSTDCYDHDIMSSISQSGDYLISDSYIDLVTVIRDLLKCLENVRGRYDELRPLEIIVDDLCELCQLSDTESTSPSPLLIRRDSDVSMSIENALGAFDFLENEVDTENMKLGQDSLSPKSTTKTTDSGIECLPTPEVTSLHTTGHPEIDQCMKYHLIYCHRLIKRISTNGPLKCQHMYSLAKIERQSEIITKLLRISQYNPPIPDLRKFIKSLTSSGQLLTFWLALSAKTGCLLFASSKYFICALHDMYSDILLKQYSVNTNKVFMEFTSRVLDDSYTLTDVTLHQFTAYFDDKQTIDIQHCLLNLAAEIVLQEQLSSLTSSVVLNAIDACTDPGLTSLQSLAPSSITPCELPEPVLPPVTCIQLLALLTRCPSSSIKSSADNFFKNVCESTHNRNQILLLMLESLEENNALLRIASCHCLSIIKAEETIDHLCFLSQSDSNEDVKNSAKLALYSFGTKGQSSYELSTLASNGFQGLNLRYSS